MSVPETQMSCEQTVLGVASFVSHKSIYLSIVVICLFTINHVLMARSLLEYDCEYRFWKNLRGSQSVFYDSSTYWVRTAGLWNEDRTGGQKQEFSKRKCAQINFKLVAVHLPARTE